MKLQKRLSRKYKGRNYYKYLIVIPEEDISKAGFKEGDNLISDINKGVIKLKRIL